MKPLQAPNAFLALAALAAPAAPPARALPASPRRGWIAVVLLAAVAVGGRAAESAGPDSVAAWHHPRRILVMPAGDPSSLDRLKAFHAGCGRRVLRSFPGQGGLEVVALAAGESVAAALAQCRASGLVRFAEPDCRVRAAGTFPGDPRFQDGTQWWLNNYGQNGGSADADIDAPEAWDVAREAPDVVVAVIDTGIRLTHEDLAQNLWTNPADQTHGFNALTDTHDPTDDNGHGTHLAGIIGAVGDNGKGGAGVAWQVRIMACKFLDSTANGYSSDAIACIEFARSHGARVLNLSWGGPEYSESLSNALWTAGQDGIVVAGAAGNNAADTDLTPYYPASLPLDNLVAVGASTRSDSMWTLSDYGAHSVALFAPGASIYSTGADGDSAYISRSGSSMAAACVSGALALLCQREPGAGPRERVGRLLAAVDPAPAFAGKCASGGRLNLRRMIDRPSLAPPGSNASPFVVRVQGAPDHNYTLEGSTNLVAWTTVQTNRTASDGAWIYTDPASNNFAIRFYRSGPAP